MKDPTNCRRKTDLALMNSESLHIGHGKVFNYFRRKNNLEEIIRAGGRVHKIFWPNKISNTELLERSDMSDIKLTIKRRKWRWLGHTLRKGQDDITNQSLKWNPVRIL